MLNFLNKFAYKPFTFLNKILVNNALSFKDILGIECTAISVMSISAFLKVTNQYKNPGIYVIYFIAEGKFYIGSAYNLTYRLRQLLIWRKDSSKALQKAIDNYSKNNFFPPRPLAAEFPRSPSGERGNEGTRERGNEGTRERGNEGTRELGFLG